MKHIILKQGAETEKCFRFYTVRRMEREIDTSREYVYKGKFEGNILVVGRTVCGKTTFIQILGKVGLLGEEIVEVFWVAKIHLSKERE